MTRLLLPQEVAEIRRTTEGTLAQERHRGEGPPFVKAGRKVLYPADELDRWLAARTVRASQ